MSTKISRITYKLRNAQPVPKPTRKQTHANLVSHYCALCGNWDERAKLGQADELGQKIFGTKLMKNLNFCEETSTVWRFKIFEVLLFRSVAHETHGSECVVQTKRKLYTRSRFCKK